MPLPPGPQPSNNLLLPGSNQTILLMKADTWINGYGLPPPLYPNVPPPYANVLGWSIRANGGSSTLSGKVLDASVNPDPTEMINGFNVSWPNVPFTSSLGWTAGYNVSGPRSIQAADWGLTGEQVTVTVPDNLMSVLLPTLGTGSLWPTNTNWIVVNVQYYWYCDSTLTDYLSSEYIWYSTEIMYVPNTWEPSGGQSSSSSASSSSSIGSSSSSGLTSGSSSSGGNGSNSSDGSLSSSSGGGNWCADRLFMTSTIYIPSSYERIVARLAIDEWRTKRRKS